MSRKPRSIIPAYRVRERSKGAGEVEEYVNEILLLIEDVIEDALENMENKIVTEINTNFDIPCMTNKDAQRDVYYHLAQALTKAGYQVGFEYKGRKSENQQVLVHISWKSTNEDRMNDYKDKFLEQLIINPPSPERRYGNILNSNRRKRKNGKR